MVDRYALGSLLAAILALAALYKSFGKGNGRGESSAGNSFSPSSSSSSFSTTTTTTTTTTSINAECRSKNGGGDDVDIIIVGAGVGGAALAHTLGKDRRRVHVIERDLTEPDQIVGELLQPGGYLKLIELGLEDCVEKIDAQRVFGYALFKDGRNTQLSYPLEKFHSNISGMSFHNGRFIQSMREKAASLPNVRLEQGTVTSLLEGNGTIKGVQYKTKNGEELATYAPLTILCDGCFSNLRRSLCNPQVDVPSCFVGLLLENCELPHENHGHVILADPSPILFYRISSTEIRCLVDVPGQMVPSISNSEMAKYLNTIVAPQIPPQLQSSFIAAIDEGNIRTMPNRSMLADPHPTRGALLMGDAFNMRHPLTGGGMTVALSDIVVLRDLLRSMHDLNDAPTLCRYLESFNTLRMIGASYAAGAASSVPVQENCEPFAYSIGSEDEFGDFDWDNLGFEIKPTDYMYVTKCTKDGVFEQGQLKRYGNIELNPSAGVLNYGQGLFEGTKAFRREDGRLFLFRPDLNAIRMQLGADRMCMPSPSIDQFIDAVKQTALANRRWIPPPGKGSLYIRPLLIGSGPILGIAPAPEYTFLVYATPVGNYFKEGVSPLNLYIEEEFHRATRGGAGGVKSITNYAPVLKALLQAKSRGFSDVIYLDSVHKKNLEELTSCNIFVVKGNCISTPPTHGNILPGVTRKTAIEIARDHGYQVEERAIPVEELLDGDEVFCTGTAVGFAAVGSITYQGKRVEYKRDGQLVSGDLYSILEGIRSGLTEDKKGWLVEIE